MPRPDPRSRRHRDAVIADLVRTNGPEFLDRDTFDAVKRTSVYEWATFSDAVDDLIEEVGRAARRDARRVAKFIEAFARSLGRRR